MTAFTAQPIVGITNEIILERRAQDEKWGEQNHPDGTGGEYNKWLAQGCIDATNEAAEDGSITWKHILREEYAEAMAESDPVRLREELIQVAAVAAAWVEAIDRRDK